MMKYFKLLLLQVFITVSVLGLRAQRLTVYADDYKHQFEGAGVSIGLFLGHHYSMNAANQDKAIRLINKDLNMKYLQDYIGIYPAEDPAYFDRRANYIKAAKQYREDIQVSMVGNIFPDQLRTDITVGGRTYRVLDTDDPDIYDKLADWYFKLFKGFHDRGVDVDILNVVNEPDLANCNNQCRRYHYGYDGDTQRGVALIFTRAVPKFKEMLNDPTINTTGMKIPKIMGPSTISPNGCLSYIRYFKANYPAAWDQVDIVATHQYINGSRDDLFQEILGEIEGKAFHQSETHASRFANQADDLGSLPVAEDHRTALSLASLFGTAVNNGVSAWYYFENNYPNDFHPGGLIHVAWASQNPEPYKHYYAYKQLTSAQPAFSHVVGHEMTDISNAEVTTFRKQGEDTIYVHFSNFLSVNKQITVAVEENASAKEITSLSIRRTNGVNNDEVVLNETFEEGPTEVSFVAGPYSVNTVKIGMSNVITSIDRPASKKDIKFFHINGELTVSTINTGPIQAISAYTSTGQLIFEEEGINALSFTKRGDHFNPGMMIIRVLTNDRSYTKKLIIH